MGSGITLSGFNKIDFNMILEAVMQQERAPLAALETQQRTLLSQQSRFGTLATKLSALESAAGALSGATDFGGRAITNSDPTLLSASSGNTAPAGIYDIEVQELARAQVMASASTHADANVTPVATGGTLIINGVTVEVNEPLTLEDLAAQINRTANVGVSATVVRASASSYRIVLTGQTTGTGGRFTVINAMTGGAMSFGDANSDGVSGDSDADNAVQAIDAKVRVNNVEVVSGTNTIEGAIPGVTLSLLKKSPGTTSTVTIGSDMADTKARIKKFVDAFNDLVKFTDDQRAAATGGDQTTLARDPVLRGLRMAVRDKLLGDYTSGGTYASLASVGFTLDRSGRLELKQSIFDAAIANNFTDVKNLFTGNGVSKGLAGTLAETIETYTSNTGLLRNTRDRMSDQVQALDRRIGAWNDRLALRRATLQKEYIAADMLMSQLNANSGALSALGASYNF